jgi:hypothetical protein
MKRILQEILISLGYPAILSAGFFALLPLTGQPNPDGSPALSDFQFWICVGIALGALVGVIIYAVWDFDRDFEPGFWRRLLQIVLRVAFVMLFFGPFIFFYMILFTIFGNLVIAFSI